MRKINANLQLGILDLARFSQIMGIEHHRELEAAGARALVSKVLGTADFTVHYDAHGKPHLKNDPRGISVSHSHDRLAVLVARNMQAGVDIELIRDKVLRIRHKFLNPAEKEAAGEDVRELIIYWSAKEALYKYNGKKGVDFIRDLAVTHNDGHYTGTISYNGSSVTCALRVEQIGEYIIVYIENEITG